MTNDEEIFVKLGALREHHFGKKSGEQVTIDNEETLTKYIKDHLNLVSRLETDYEKPFPVDLKDLYFDYDVTISLHKLNAPIFLSLDLSNTFFRKSCRINTPENHHVEILTSALTKFNSLKVYGNGAFSGHFVGIKIQEFDLFHASVYNTNFDGAHIGVFKLINCTAHGLSMCYTKIKTEASFDRVIFPTPPKMHDTEFTHNISFRGCRFIKKTIHRYIDNYSFIRRAKSLWIGSQEGLEDFNSFKSLKSLARSANDEWAEKEFYSRELGERFRSLGYKKHFWEKSALLVYGQLNDFGWSIGKPFGHLLCLWLISAQLYLYNNTLSVNQTSLEGWVREIAKMSGYEQALYYSFGNSFPIVRAINPSDLFHIATLNMKIYSLVQIILSVVLWFVLIMTIRSRFKLS